MIAVEGVEQSEMIRYKLPQAARTSLWPPDEEEPPVLVVVMTPFHHVDHIEFFTSLLPLSFHWVGRDAAPKRQRLAKRTQILDIRYIMDRDSVSDSCGGALIVCLCLTERKAKADGAHTDQRQHEQVDPRGMGPSLTHYFFVSWHSVLPLVGVAACAERAGPAIWIANPADGRAQLDESLIDVSRPVGPLNHRGCTRP